MILQYLQQVLALKNEENFYHAVFHRKYLNKSVSAKVSNENP